MLTMVRTSCSNLSYLHEKMALELGLKCGHTEVGMRMERTERQEERLGGGQSGPRISLSVFFLCSISIVVMFVLLFAYLLSLQTGCRALWEQGLRTRSVCQVPVTIYRYIKGLSKYVSYKARKESLERN